MKSLLQSVSVKFVVACLCILIFFIVGAVLHWPWAGFDKPLYDWMQLLIIPVALALLAVWFNRNERRNEQALAVDNQQEAALQGYIDRISELLLHENLRESKPSDEVRNIARVRTLTILYQLNTRRINYLLTFLRESGLITDDAKTSIVTLSQADLSKIDLHDVSLNKLDLSGTNFRGANLSGAWLNKTNLSGAIFSGANLSGANFSKANLSGAFFIGSNLNGTVFSNANLSRVSFSGANFDGTMLFGANLSDANFTLAKYVVEEDISSKLIKAIKVDLRKAHLKGATIDSLSLEEVSLTDEQIKTMNIIPSLGTYNST